MSKMSFIQILENPELKSLVESLEHGSSDPEIIDNLKSELLEKSGWVWQD